MRLPGSAWRGPLHPQGTSSLRSLQHPVGRGGVWVPPWRSEPGQETRLVPVLGSRSPPARPDHPLSFSPRPRAKRASSTSIPRPGPCWRPAGGLATVRGSARPRPSPLSRTPRPRGLRAWHGHPWHSAYPGSRSPGPALSPGATHGAPQLTSLQPWTGFARTRHAKKAPCCHRGIGGHPQKSKVSSQQLNLELCSRLINEIQSHRPLGSAGIGGHWGWASRPAGRTSTTRAPRPLLRPPQSVP